MRRILVTGGGGFLGSKICTLLHALGDEVVALGRRDYPHLRDLGIGHIIADLRDRSAIAKACTGIDVVIHTAALAGIWGDPADFWSINLEGTRHVIDACRQHRVRRLIYTSSPSVVFDERDIINGQESLPYPARHLAEYPASKAAAEKLVLAANGDELATIALRPHLIWGPGDTHLIPRIISKARERRLYQVGDGENLVDITYIDNAAQAHGQAVDRLAIGAPCAGRAYFISQGDPVRLWPWINQLLQRLRISTVSKKISLRRAWTIGLVLEKWHQLIKNWQEPPMTRFLAGQLARSHFFDISAARRDLGYEPRVTMEQGLEHLVADLWARTNLGKP
ncbi:MAG: 2-alkyl-3-oxoalkanoate reductase [Phycisphaerae bacterium]|nr:2-alkyl-3-oxoalkanoate reductase [Phycisphaerae bacterium]